MNLKEIKELVEFLKEQDIAEFELERGDVKVRLKRGMQTLAVPHLPAQPMPVLAPEITSAAAPAQTGISAAKESAAPAETLHAVRSPIVGTYYESPSPGSPPFVKPGDTVEVGQVLCIVEAMKLMNEIEADVAGEIVKSLVSNGQPIEYGQELFLIRPKA